MRPWKRVRELGGRMIETITLRYFFLDGERGLIPNRSRSANESDKILKDSQEGIATILDASQ